MARPEKYKQEYISQASVACKLGATDADLAELFSVSVRTIHYWKTNYEDFANALKIGKEYADERVKNALYHRALGYSHEEDDIRTIGGASGSEIVITPTIKHYPPDTAACIFWLKNRKPQEWRANPEPGDDDYVQPVKIEVSVVDASVDKPAT